LVIFLQLARRAAWPARCSMLYMSFSEYGRAGCTHFQHQQYVRMCMVYPFPPPATVLGIRDILMWIRIRGSVPLSHRVLIFLQSSELGLNPSTAGECAPFPRFWGEGRTRWQERGWDWESPNSDEGTHSVVLFISTYFVL
jgi:hypothetical protein